MVNGEWGFSIFIYEVDINFIVYTLYIYHSPLTIHHFN
jgi:hypothetical protein